jgi:hypothetical protein
LGFEWAGFEVRWQVECEPFCCAVLAKHWPDVPRYDDVRTCYGETRMADAGSQEQLARAGVGAPTMKPKPPLEKVEQQHGVQLLRTLGADVWVTGIPRRKGDYQGAMRTPGLVDVMAFLPTAPGHCLLLWEVKRQGEERRLRPEQTRFRDLVRDLGSPSVVDHLVGPYDALFGWLVQRGYLYEKSLPHYRTRKSP